MNFREKVQQKRFVICMETVPPKSTNLEKKLAKLRPFKDKIDATTVVDSPLGIPMMHPMPVCYKIQEQLGIETIMHFTCRDRNSIEIQADLLAASMLGIKNVLALTGDPTTNSKPVYEFNSISLIKFIKEMNIQKGTDFFVGAGLNINSDVEKESERAKKKIDAGAQFFITQPCFDAKRVEEFSDRLAIPIISGVLILSDRKTAEFYSKVAGVKIPDVLFDIVEDKTKVLEFYRNLLSELRKTSGVCLMPIGNYEIVEELINQNIK
jgi:5,10-methylenetetrahydrofolate reductase